MTVLLFEKIENEKANDKKPKSHKWDKTSAIMPVHTFNYINAIQVHIYLTSYLRVECTVTELLGQSVERVERNLSCSAD